ncbi:MAG: UDP-3-O-(3-hydroxymyristoyl)glucosamine N-acyltransferase [Rhizomicrobium sp.]
MSDDRFFQADGPFSLGRIAEIVGAELAHPERAGEMIRDVAELADATSGELAVFCDPRHAPAFATSHASVVVTSKKLSAYPHNGSALLLVDDPRLAFARIGKLFYPRAQPKAFIHSRAFVAASAHVGDDTEIACGAVVGENAQIGARCRLAPNAVIGDGVIIGDDTVIGANTSISHALIGAKVSIAENVSIGGEGFGFVPGPKGPMRVFQVGRVIIEDQVEIGGNCAIDRGSLGDTVIGAMSALDNLVQIGHNVKLGKGCILAGQAGVAGSTTLGDYVMVGGAASISDHLTIGNGAKIAGKSGVMRDVAAGETVAGYPAVPVRQWHRQTAALAKLVARACGKD